MQFTILETCNIRKYIFNSKNIVSGVTEIVFIIIQQLSSQKYAIALAYVFCIINSILWSVYVR